MTSRGGAYNFQEQHSTTVQVRIKQTKTYTYNASALLIRLISMYELHVQLIVFVLLIFHRSFELPGKSLSEGFDKYDYTCKLPCRTGSAQEQLHVVEFIEET